jgi:DNA-binding LacI/PurR family transcriptional regulator
MPTSRPTMQTVATAAGVSPMTVSNAYNRPDQLTAATRERVLEIARQLGYPGPDPAAQSLRRRSTGAIGVAITTRLTDAFTDPGLVLVLKGIASQLSETGGSLLLLPGGSAGGVSAVRQAIADAIVLCDLAADDPAVIDAISRRIPLVTIGHPKLPGVPRIAIDNHRAAELAASHLVALGHQRFCVLTIAGAGGGADPAGRPSIEARTAGFTAALAAAGIAPDQVLRRAAENTFAGAAAVMSEVLAAPAPRRPTAVFAVTDVLALGTLAAARTAGLSVPGHLSVVGFDDIAEAAASSPPLTTVSQPLFRQGQAAAEIALALIAGQRYHVPRVTAELVVRASTGPRHAG